MLTAHLKPFTLTAICLFSSLAQANYSLTGYAGYHGHQSITTEQGDTLEFDKSSHFALSMDIDIPNAIVGVYYSKQQNQLTQTPQFDADMQFLLFQSAVKFRLSPDFSSYVGAQVGVNHIDVYDNADSYFATGLFTGLEYHLLENIAFVSELRWIGSLVNNNSTINCPANDEQCIWQFDGDVLHQFQANLGLRVRF